jgi:hypothetical protein
MLAVSPEFLEGAAAVLLIVMMLATYFILSGCAAEPVKPIVQTVVVEKPVPVLCRVATIERPAWETERANPADPVMVSRAIRSELEQARAYLTQLEAAARACQ